MSVWVNAANQSNLSVGSAWNDQSLPWRVTQNLPVFMTSGHLGPLLHANASAGTVIVRHGESASRLNREEWTQVFNHCRKEI